MILKLRAHHCLCLNYFTGKGYDRAFTENMTAVKALAETDPQVMITSDSDAICAKCPNLKSGVCATFDKVLKYDVKVSQLSGLKIGSVYRFSTIEKAIEANILVPDKRSQICCDCQWNDLCQKIHDSKFGKSI